MINSRYNTKETSAFLQNNTCDPLKDRYGFLFPEADMPRAISTILNENSVPMKFSLLALSAMLGVFGVAYSLLINRMDKQEILATRDIAALREDIKNTTLDTKDSVAATASAMKDTAAVTAGALNDKLYGLSQRIERLENRIDRCLTNHQLPREGDVIPLAE